MRISLLTHRYWPHVGGVEKYVHELAKALVGMGNVVNVVAGDTTGGLVQREDHDDVAIHRFPATRSKARCHLWFIRNHRLFTKADVVHISNTHMLEYFRRMIGRVVDKRRVFLTRHGMSCQCPVSSSERARARRSLKHVAGVVHDGVFIGKWLGVTATICPNQGLSPEADVRRVTPEPPADSAVYIGRFEPDTGARMYVDAVRELTRVRRIPFRLDMYGSGSLVPELRTTVQRERLPVVFHGSTPDAQDRIAAACFAFVDGRTVIQEAMARKRLVLAGYTDTRKRDYVCGERFSPFLVPVANATELVDRTIYFIEHPDERRRMTERAFDHACTLTWRRTAVAFMDMWQQRLPQTGWPVAKRTRTTHQGIGRKNVQRANVRSAVGIDCKTGLSQRDDRGPIRVLVDARMLMGRFSGVARYVTRLIDELGRLDGVRVVALCGRTVPEVLAGRDDVETLATNFDRSDRTAIRRLWWEETQLIRWIRESHADIFHATWNTGIPRRCPIPSVLTIHDLIPLHDPDTHFSSRSQFAAYRHALRSSVARASRTITVSDHVRSDLTDTLGMDGNRVVRVHNGVDMPPHRLDGPGSDHPPFVLHTGGPLPRKNVAAVFRAIAEYWFGYGESLEVRVTFLEAELCREARRAFQQMRLPKQVRFIGHVDDRTLSEQYVAARAVLVLSRDEGFGLPVLEAMAHGCPVIAASNASLPEIVGNAGVLVDPENGRSVADEVHRIITDHAWRDRLVRLGRMRAKRFGWDVCAQRVREVYDIALADASFSQHRQRRVRWGPSRSSRVKPTVPS